MNQTNPISSEPPLPSDSFYRAIGIKPTVSEWLLSRPACVQELAKEFPPNSVIHIEGKLFFIFGYTENDKLILAPLDSRNYDEAMENRMYLCAGHLRTPL